MGERGKIDPAERGAPHQHERVHGTARTSDPVRSWEEQRQAGAGADRGRAGSFRPRRFRSREQAGSGGIGCLQMVRRPPDVDR